MASQCDDEPGKPSTAVADNTQRIRCRIKYFLGLAAIVPVVGTRSHAPADVFNMYVIQFPNHPDEMCGDPWLPTEKGNFRVSDFARLGWPKQPSLKLKFSFRAWLRPGRRRGPMRTGADYKFSIRLETRVGS